jgi:hypothetical protein
MLWLIHLSGGSSAQADAVAYAGNMVTSALVLLDRGRRLFRFATSCVSCAVLVGLLFSTRKAFFASVCQPVNGVIVPNVNRTDVKNAAVLEGA